MKRPDLIWLGHNKSEQKASGTLIICLSWVVVIALIGVWMIYG
uniref:Uncharacterized protein n=1 Tax=Siphoviridae sp. ctQtc11 TaxID=2825497 RepID=A0A8S5P496_9CAUD|nr:MAG TPA: hypothetical protein [Siphoviridae sp. ctQtc11]